MMINLPISDTLTSFSYSLLLNTHITDANYQYIHFKRIQTTNTPKLISSTLSIVKKQQVLFSGIDDNCIYYLNKKKRWNKILFDHERELEGNNVINSKNNESMKNYICVEPCERIGACAIVVDDELVIFGGNDIKNDRLLNDLWIFRKNKWSLVVDPNNNEPIRRWYASIIKYEKLLIIFGGETDNMKLINNISIFDYSKEVWLKLRSFDKLPNPRLLHSANLINRKMYIIGGYFGGIKNIDNKIWVFDLDLFKWSEIASKNECNSLYGHSSFSWGNKIVIFGGKSNADQKISNSLWTYDTKYNIWEKINVFQNIPLPRWKMMYCSYTDVVEKKINDKIKGDTIEIVKEVESFGKTNKLNPIVYQDENYIERVTHCYIYGGKDENENYYDLWYLKLKIKQEKVY